VEGVVSGLLRSKGERREPRTPQISNQIDATELVTLSSFSDKVPTETKQAMACRLCDCNDKSTPGLAIFCRFVEKTGLFHGNIRPGKNSFCRAEKTTRQKSRKISFANSCQVEKKDF
jgi:hypothetical protein